MPYYDRPVLICDKCLKEIKPGASIKVSQIVTYKGVNFASTLNEHYASSWPILGEEGVLKEITYEHNINCIPRQ